MAGNVWNVKETEALWKLWSEYGRTISEFATEYAALLKRTAPSIRAKVNELEHQRGKKIPASNYSKWENQLKLTGDWFVLMDAHFPFHKSEFINQCLEACSKMKIKNAILGGDALDFHALNQFAENFADEGKMVIDSRLRDVLLSFADKLDNKERQELYSTLADAETEKGNISEEIRATREIMKALETHFDSIVWIMGNHEARVTRILQNVLEVSTIARLFGADNPRWQVTGYYWCELESGGTKWQIEHPINTGKHSSKRMAPKYQSNIIMGHNHHFSVTTDPSGKYVAIEPGMGADEARMDYVMQRHNTADMHVNGAVIVKNGYYHLLNKFTDWSIYFE